MTYATLAGLTHRYGEDVLLSVADRSTPPAGVADPAVIDRALENTDAVINASLAVRYRLPLASVPAIVVDLAEAIAIYKLHRFAPDAKIQADYDQALRDLAHIADGRKKLDVAGVEPTTSGTGGVLAIDRERPLSPESMTGFI
jgi:phage gp36-like protein